MSTVFFGGSRKLPHLNSEIRARLRNLISGHHRILVGDANGADKAIQSFFSDEGYRNVTVYCMDKHCRNNLGRWPTKSIDSDGRKKDYSYFALKDAEMSKEADYGFMLWDGKSKGTLNNILNLLQQDKPALVYFSKSKSFVPIKTNEDLHRLVAQCDESSKRNFEKKIKLSERLKSQQGSLDFA